MVTVAQPAANTLGEKGPQSAVLLTSAARTVTTSVEFSAGPFHQYVDVVLTSQVQAGAGLTLSLEGYDPASDAWETLATAAKLSAAGTKFLLVGPDVTASANIAVQRLPRDRLRATVTVDDATSYTYSVAVHVA